MKEFVDKVSSYNIFNYLLPGTLFAFFLSKTTSYSLLQSDLITGTFLYYFIGLVISRLGSLIVEPFLKKIRFLKFADYPSFVTASKKEPKIELFSEVNNMYRALVTMFLLLILINIYFYSIFIIPDLKYFNSSILIFTLLMIFLLSYKKQTTYIVKRIKELKK